MQTQINCDIFTIRVTRNRTKKIHSIKSEPKKWNSYKTKFGTYAVTVVLFMWFVSLFVCVTVTKCIIKSLIKNHSQLKTCAESHWICWVHVTSQWPPVIPYLLPNDWYLSTFNTLWNSAPQIAIRKPKVSSHYNSTDQNRGHSIKSDAIWSKNEYHWCFCTTQLTWLIHVPKLQFVICRGGHL